MIYLLKIAQFILKILIQYVLNPFALLTGELVEILEKTKNKFVYYLIKIPYWIIFPITFVWTLLTFQYFNNQEKLKRYKIVNI
jgi:hypothetical protein